MIRFFVLFLVALGVLFGAELTEPHSQVHEPGRLAAALRALL